MADKYICIKEVQLVENNILTHSGKLGMRWGHRTITKALGLPNTNRKSLVKIQPEKKVETTNDIKARVLKSSSAKELYKNKDLFTYDELNAAKLRLDLERSIKDISGKEISKGQQRVQKLIKTTITISSVLTEGTKVYNTTAKIYNAFKAPVKPLPLIGEKKIL